MLNKIIVSTINSIVIFLNVLKKNAIFLVIISLFGISLGVYLENYNFKKKNFYQGFSEIDVDMGFQHLNENSSFSTGKNIFSVGLLNEFSNFNDSFKSEFNDNKLNSKEFYNKDINKYCTKDANKHFDNYLNLSTNKGNYFIKINLSIQNNSKSEIEECYNYIKNILILKHNTFIEQEIKKIDNYILRLTNIEEFLNEGKSIDAKKSFAKFIDLYFKFYEEFINLNKINSKTSEKDDQQLRQDFIIQLLNYEKNIFYPYEMIKDEKNKKIYFYKNINYADLSLTEKTDKKNFLKLELISIDDFLQNDDFFSDVITFKSILLINSEKKINSLKFFRNSIKNDFNINFGNLTISEKKIKSSYVPLASFLLFLISGIFLIYFKNFISYTNK
jgi:hypothetical protein